MSISLASFAWRVFAGMKRLLSQYGRTFNRTPEPFMLPKRLPPFPLPLNIGWAGLVHVQPILPATAPDDRHPFLSFELYVGRGRHGS